MYIGVTSDLVQHKNALAAGFTKKYNVKNLVYYEKHESALSAISREKSLKNWHRKCKLDLIEKTNPNWNDLYKNI